LKKHPVILFNKIAAKLVVLLLLTVFAHLNSDLIHLADRPAKQGTQTEARVLLRCDHAASCHVFIFEEPTPLRISLQAEHPVIGNMPVRQFLLQQTYWRPPQLNQISF
jgi:hypothetical protein